MTSEDCDKICGKLSDINDTLKGIGRLLERLAYPAMAATSPSAAPPGSAPKKPEDAVDKIVAEAEATRKPNL